MDWKDTLVRAAKTFVQTFIGAAGLGLTGLLNVATLRAAAFAAASAAVSVLMNAALQWSASR